ncbi:hypothetical protein JW766_03200 [Candidatus Dojkabacteria bacterium]|nr:hypothetical protein [Candidatus Dojkabacteria bacterium]
MTYISTPEFEPSITQTAEVSSAAQELLAREVTSLQAAWCMPHTQILIGKAIGREVPDSEVNLSHARREREGTPHRFIEAMTDVLISVGEKYSNQVSERRETPEEVASGLATWAENELSYIYICSQRRTEKREYSAHHRIACLAIQSIMVYTALIELGAYEGLETYRLSLIITLKSKMDRINPNEKVSDYALALAALGEWDVDPEEYNEVYRGEGVTNYPYRVADIQNQRTIVLAYLYLPERDRHFLQAITIPGTDMTYDAAVRLYYGINDQETRDSFFALENKSGIHWNAFRNRMDHIVRYIMQAHESPFFYDRLEALESSLEDPDYPLTPFTIAGLEGEIPVTACTFAEIEAYWDLQQVEERLAEFHQLEQEEQWRAVFAFRSELEFYLRFLTQLRVNIVEELQTGDYSVSERYKALERAEFAHLVAQSQLCCQYFPITLTEKFPFLQTGLSSSVCSKLAAVILEKTEAVTLKDVRLGLAYRDRIVSTEMLLDIGLIEGRISPVIELLTAEDAQGKTREKQSVAKALNLHPQTLSHLTTYLIVEAVCSGIANPIDRRRLAVALKTSPEKLEELVVSPQDPKYYKKIQQAFIHITYRTKRSKNSTSSHSQKGLARGNDLALEIACSNLAQGSFFPVAQFILFTILQGYSGRQVAHMITDRESTLALRSKITTALTETAKVLSARPRAR